MAFHRDDFYVGMIVWYTIDQLQRDKRVRKRSITSDHKPRPFVCYAEEAGESYWTCFTTVRKNWRDMVDRAWLRYPAGIFAPNNHLVINCGRNTYAGSVRIFADLSRRYDKFDGYVRPFLTREGVATVQETVLFAGGFLPQTVQMTTRQSAYERAA